MYFNKTGTVLPAEKIKLTVKADAGSKVNVLAVDKSVMLLKSGNDITKDQVSLITFTRGCVTVQNDAYMYM